MQSTRTIQGKTLVIALNGRLDTLSAGELEKEFNGIPEEIDEVLLDFAMLKYISSAGLRVIVKAKRDLDAQRLVFSIRNTQKNVMEVFRMTKFDEIIDIS